jgi:hypothetical protein
MAVTLNASNSGTGGLSVTSDATGNLAFQTAGTTAVTVDTSQNVGIGVTPQTWTVYDRVLQLGSSAAFYTYQQTELNISTNQYYNAGIKYLGTGASARYQQSAGAHIWYYAGSGSAGGTISYTESMRIDSSGKVTVGSTAQTKGNINIWNPASTQTNLYLFKNTQVEAYFGFLGSTDSNLYVNTGGTMGSTGVYMGNGGTSWTSNSDERLKENLVPITDGLNKVSSLRSVIGNFIADENKTARPFLIAQDVQSVLPEAVSQGAEIDGIKYLGVSYTDVIPLLVASIKDLKAINDSQAETITALTARIVALEK